MRRALVVLAALASSSVSCDVCGLIDQQIIVAPDDPELGGLRSDCLLGAPPPADLGCTKSADGNPEITCSCLPLCERVYGLVNPNPRRTPLVGCTFDAGRNEVRVKYRSACQ